MIDPGLVLAWGAPRLRDLPWRHTRDPWQILVAEVMLQQTQVDRVVPKWEAFLSEFPDAVTCANASLGDVLRAWQGLGYPRRARNLHSTAVVVRDLHAGCLPADLGALQTLPGVGPYTSRALLAFAFEHDVGVVDTNIARVLARVAGERLTARRAQTLADDVVPVGAGWMWNQTLMDLGATVCRPTPACHACPLRSVCSWALAGHPGPDPAVGSAGVSTRQAPFEGSTRQARGQVLRSLVAGARAGSDLDRTVVETLLADGLVVEDADGTLSLP